MRAVRWASWKEERSEPSSVAFFPSSRKAEHDLRPPRRYFFGVCMCVRPSVQIDGTTPGAISLCGSAFQEKWASVRSSAFPFDDRQVSVPEMVAISLDNAPHKQCLPSMSPCYQLLCGYVAVFCPSDSIYHGKSYLSSQWHAYGARCIFYSRHGRGSCERIGAQCDNLWLFCGARQFL